LIDQKIDFEKRTPLFRTFKIDPTDMRRTKVFKLTPQMARERRENALKE